METALTSGRLPHLQKLSTRLQYYQHPETQRVLLSSKTFMHRKPPWLERAPAPVTLPDDIFRGFSVTSSKKWFIDCRHDLLFEHRAPVMPPDWWRHYISGLPIYPSSPLRNATRDVLQICHKCQLALELIRF